MKLTLEKDKIYLYAFAVMTGIYGLFSSMIPDRLGIAELIIALLLAIIALNGFLYIIYPKNHSEKRDTSNRLIFLYLFFIPTITGLFLQNMLVDIVRDLLPLLFFLLPIFILTHIKKSPDIWFRYLSTSLVFIGIMMSIRHFAGSSISITEIGTKPIFVDEGISLANDPSTLFASIFLVGMGFYFLGQKRTGLGLSCLALAIIPISATLAATARAPSAMIVIATLLFIVQNISHGSNKVFKLITFTSLIAIAVILNLDVLKGVYELLLLKHETYGNTIREIELIVAIEFMTKDITTFMIGGGWGALLNHPLANGGQWSFIHNMFGYFAFKTGILGLIILCMYLIWIVTLGLRALIQKNQIVFITLIATSAPLLINAIFEVGYKTLPFGLLICLIISSYFYSQLHSKTSL